MSTTCPGMDKTQVTAGAMALGVNAALCVEEVRGTGFGKKCHHLL